MKLAAIDIGSNAVRLLIKDTARPDFLARLDDIGPTDFYERRPLKSGIDVYAHGRILPATALRLTAIISRFAAIINKVGVARYRACATASYRDARNGRSVIRDISAATGLNIEVISGEEEARLTRLSLTLPPQWQSVPVVISDVGGGSTELTLLRGSDVLFSHSFQIGSMRYACHRQDPAEETRLDQRMAFIHTQFPSIHYLGVGGCVRFLCSYINNVGAGFNARPPETANVGAGFNARPPETANVGALPSVRPQTTASDSPAPSPFPSFPVSRLDEIYSDLLGRTVDSIVEHYRLPHERADILTPAASIFLRIAHALNADTVYVPSIGVRNGIITDLFRNNM